MHPTLFQKYRKNLLALTLAFMTVLSVIAYASLSPAGSEFAGAAVQGNPEGADYRALIASDGTDRVRRITYFKLEPHATGGANTPVATGKVCEMAGMLHSAEVKLSGTMAGTAPTLAIKWQNSKDNGATWTDVGTWTQINATVTPASQSQVVSDIIASTAVIYGDCWRATYTMTGTGAAAVFSVTGLEK
jgi:hypothetical protein